MKTERSSLVDGTYKKIIQELQSGDYSIGTKLQPIRSLAKRFDVSYLTAQKAIKALQLQGTLEARPGDGLYVTGKIKPLETSVIECLEENTIATGASRKKVGTHSLSIVMPFWISERGESHIYRMIKGILAQSDLHHWPIELIHNSGDLSSSESAHPDFIAKIESRKPDGIIWLQPILAHKMNLMRLVDRGYTVVVTGRNFKDIPVTCVQMDIDDMAEKVVAYLLEKNSTKIAMLTGPIEGQFIDPHSVDIVNAVRNAMSKRKLELPYDMICQATFTPSDGLIVHSLIERNPDINGIICLHETHMIEELDKMDCTGFFKDSPIINMVNTSGIYHIGHYNSLTHFKMINVGWPLENIGRAVIRVFENEWLESPPTTPLDLSVEIIRG